MTDRGERSGKVYLIGAGPGDAKLLTLKAVEALAESDSIVYDYLVNPEVLAHAKRGVELIYAGKRAGMESTPQYEINRLLIEQARAGRTVARLKGGDPFIFGRGGEEAEALAEAGVRWEVIPGISAGVAAAAYAGIPLTHRDYASSVAFVTGRDGLTARDGIDWKAAARAADTLVIFMCAETVAKIARALIENGRRPATPIAIIRWATYPYQEVYSGTLEDIAERGESDDAGRIKIKPPAIAVVGEVVSLRSRLRWFGCESQYTVGEATASAIEG
ncbi:MAG TPA: uroporphyrinogen-III C-methyltransferase [Blastocatellia bacterium]|nr:uroporphyrinogen-III C-methyltransferase [Blastocatellia bacterium]